MVHVLKYQIESTLNSMQTDAENLTLVYNMCRKFQEATHSGVQKTAMEKRFLVRRNTQKN